MEGSPQDSEQGISLRDLVTNQEQDHPQQKGGKLQKGYMAQP